MEIKSIILVVDDDHNVRLSLDFLLEEHGHHVLEAKSTIDAQRILDTQKVDLILLDMNYEDDTTSGKEGLAFLQELHKKNNVIPIVAMTAWANLDVAIPAMQAGASDFIEKPWNNQRLLLIVNQQLKVANLNRKNQAMHQLIHRPHGEVFAWQSQIMQELNENISRVARSDASIMLTGENGTGKSTIAQQIHQHSSRSDEMLVVVNTGAIPADLFESEMFGHRKGAFTGASENRIGRFEMADGGSLFLDEISTLAPAQQAKLLRVLETGEYEPVGYSKTSRVDVRLISASNSDFKQLISDNSFRQDLYYRLNTIVLNVPPLRERTIDILPLSEHLLRHFCHKYGREKMTLSDATKSTLLRYSWPGNIRELSHVMERAALLARKNELTPTDLNLVLSGTLPTNDKPLMSLDESEKLLILKAMDASEGNIQQASEILGITPSALYRRLDKFNLNAKA